MSPSLRRPQPDDPTPWLRCRCVSVTPGYRADPYIHRCPERPTAEDGLCDHCRQRIGECVDPECLIQDTCCITGGSRVLVDLKTPCARLWNATF